MGLYRLFFCLVVWRIVFDLNKHITRHVLFYCLVASCFGMYCIPKTLLCWEIDRKTRGENRDSTSYANAVWNKFACTLTCYLLIIYFLVFVCVCCVGASADMNEDDDATRKWFRCLSHCDESCWWLAKPSCSVIIHNGWCEMALTNHVAHPKP